MFTSSSKRVFLRNSALLSLGTGASMLGAGNLALAQTADYRALVCVFLYGGNDGNNSVIPIDNASYQQYSNIRQNLAISLDDIEPLNASLGLHPSLTPLAASFAQDRLAVINNVGPLSRPMTQAQYFDWRDSHDSTQVPDSLFSHHEQQIMWENGFSSASLRTGWGGRLIDQAAPGKQVFSFNSNSRFGAGSLNREMVIPTPGQRLGLEGFSANRFGNSRMAALQALVQASDSNQLHQAMATSQQQAFTVSAELGPLLEQQPSGGNADPDNPDISAAFTDLTGDHDNYFSRQLYQVAKMIRNRSVVGGNRHVFFVTLGGFDTHSNQLGEHARLLTILGNGLAAFDQAMVALDTSELVTTFTESDFGRTLKPNDSAGTDHGWGNMHFVLGGAVAGGQSYGDYPEQELGGPDDAGQRSWEHQGRWIPQFSVDQYVGTLAQWFAPEISANLTTVLPNLSRFDQQDLGFMATPAQSG